MSSSTEVVGVVKIVNSYAVALIDSKKSTFVSKAYADEKIAQAAAMQFALLNHLGYQPKLIEMTKPLLTVMKQGDIWYPAEFHSDRISLLKEFGGTKEEAIRIAAHIAMIQGTICHPLAGISLGSVEEISKTK